MHQHQLCKVLLMMLRLRQQLPQHMPPQCQVTVAVAAACWRQHSKARQLVLVAVLSLLVLPPLHWLLPLLLQEQPHKPVRRPAQPLQQQPQHQPQQDNGPQAQHRGLVVLPLLPLHVASAIMLMC